MLLKDGKKFSLDKKFVGEFTKAITFQLCNNQGGINPETKKLQFSSQRGILPFYTMREKLPKEQGGGLMLVEVRYATSQRKDGKDGDYIYTPESIYFVKGRLVLDPNNKEDIDKLWFLRNHPKNQDPSVNQGEPVFFEVDPEKNANERVSTRTSRHQSEHKILEVWDKDQLIEIASGFDDTQADKKSKAQLQDFLLELVDRDPIDFHNKVTSSNFVLRANITKGLTLGLLKEENGVWYWGEDKDREDKSGNEICRARAGEDPKTRLIIYFNRSSESLDYFTERLKMALNPLEKAEA